MQIVNGKNLVIKSQIPVPGEGLVPLVYAAKSCQIVINTTLIETSSPTSGQYSEYRAGRKDWKINIAHLILDEVEYIPMVGETYDILVMISSTVYVGKVICRVCDIAGVIGNLAAGKIELRGTGPLTRG